MKNLLDIQYQKNVMELHNECKEMEENPPRSIYIMNILKKFPSADAANFSKVNNTYLNRHFCGFETFDHIFHCLIKAYSDRCNVSEGVSNPLLIKRNAPISADLEFSQFNWNKRPTRNGTTHCLWTETRMSNSIFRTSLDKIKNERYITTIDQPHSHILTRSRCKNLTDEDIKTCFHTHLDASLNLSATCKRNEFGFISCKHRMRPTTTSNRKRKCDMQYASQINRYPILPETRTVFTDPLWRIDRNNASNIPVATNEQLSNLNLEEICEPVESKIAKMCAFTDMTTVLPLEDELSDYDSGFSDDTTKDTPKSLILPAALPSVQTKLGNSYANTPASDNVLRVYQNTRKIRTRHMVNYPKVFLTRNKECGALFEYITEEVQRPSIDCMLDPNFSLEDINLDVQERQFEHRSLTTAPLNGAEIFSTPGCILKDDSDSIIYFEKSNFDERYLSHLTESTPPIEKIAYQHCHVDSNVAENKVRFKRRTERNQKCIDYVANTNSTIDIQVDEEVFYYEQHMLCLAR